MVVVVVPTFTKSDDRQEEVISGIVLGLEISSSPDMGKRVDGVRAVVAQNSGDKEAPNKGLARSQPKTGQKGCGEIAGS